MKSFVAPTVDELLGRSATPSSRTRSAKNKNPVTGEPSSQPSKKRARPDPVLLEIDSQRHPIVSASEALFPRGVPSIEGAVLDDPRAKQAMEGVAILIFEVLRLQTSEEGLQQSHEEACAQVGSLKAELKAAQGELDRARRDRENAEEERARTAEAMAEVRVENQLVRDKLKDVSEQATIHTRIFMMKELHAGKADSWDLASAIAEYERRFGKLEDEEAEAAEDSGAGSAVRGDEEGEEKKE